MKPGRELDTLVAEKVMKWTEYYDFEEGHWWVCDGLMTEEVKEWSPSTDVVAALQVAEKIKDSCGWIELWSSRGTDWRVSCRAQGTATAQAETLPHAICLAALKGVGA